MSMYNLIEYRDNYSKTSGILWKYGRDELSLAAHNTITDLMQIMLLLIRLKLKKK